VTTSKRSARVSRNVTEVQSKSKFSKSKAEAEVISTRRSNRGTRGEPATTEQAKSKKAKVEVAAPPKRARTPATVPEPAPARKERPGKKEPELAARSSRSTRRNAEATKVVAQKVSEKTSTEQTKKLANPPKVEQRQRRNPLGFETPSKGDAAVRETLKEQPRTRPKDVKPSKESSKGRAVQVTEKTVQAPRTSSRGAVAKLALSTRESRSNLRAEAQAREEEERARKKRASRDQRKADEAK